jgi:hypothetical protein
VVDYYIPALVAAMSYFITGGKSGAVPSLKILALDVCAKHINYLSDLANM